MDSLACPACTAGGALRLGRRGLRRCARCGHHWMVVGESVTPEQRDATYVAHYDGFRPDPRFAAAVRALLATELAPRVSTGARVLDIGCGNGEFLAAASEAGYDARGVDYYQAAVDACRARGLRADRADVLGPLPDEGPYDLVTLWDVLEHLERPAAILARCRGLLAPGGALFLKTPALGRLSVELSAAMPRWLGPLLNAPDHVQFFTPDSLDACLRQAGLTVTDRLTPQGMRSPSRGGPLRKRLGRRVVRALQRRSGDHNLLVLCRPRA